MDPIHEEVKNPILYAGFRIPFDRLSPEKFEAFAFAAFTVLGEGRGYRSISKSSGPGDGGFDLEAERGADGARVCIQCKRYAETSLSVGVVASELVKTALRAFIDGAKFVEHLIVTVGKAGSGPTSIPPSLPRSS